MFNEIGLIVFQMYIDNLMFPLNIGTPQQYFNAFFDFATVPLLITAEDCGIRRSDCPRMCNDEAMAHLYCDPLCFPINKAMYYAYCRFPFLSSNSTTYKRLNRTWKERLQCCNDPLYGRFASEMFQFGDSNETSDLELEFVEGTLIQERALPDYDVIFGLGFRDASGHVGVVEQLYQRKVIREPIISIASPLVVLGALNSQNCDSWSYFPVVSDALGWTFEVERVELFGVKFTNQQARREMTMTISSHSTYLEVPSDVRRELVDRKVVLVDCSIPKSSWCVRNSTEKTVSIHGRDYVYSLDVSIGDRCFEYANQSVCHVNTIDVQYARSNGVNSWVLPLNIYAYLRHFCYGLDYAKRTFAFGFSRVIHENGL